MDAIGNRLAEAAVRQQTVVVVIRPHKGSNLCRPVFHQSLDQPLEQVRPIAAAVHQQDEQQAQPFDVCLVGDAELGTKMGLVRLPSGDDPTVRRQKLGIGWLVGRNAREAVQYLFDAERIADEIEELRREQVDDLCLDVSIAHRELCQETPCVGFHVHLVLVKQLLQIHTEPAAPWHVEAEQIEHRKRRVDRMAAWIFEGDLVRLPIDQPKRIDPEFPACAAGIERIELLLYPRQKMLIACRVPSHASIRPPFTTRIA